MIKNIFRKRKLAREAERERERKKAKFWEAENNLRRARNAEHSGNLEEARMYWEKVSLDYEGKSLYFSAARAAEKAGLKERALRMYQEDINQDIRDMRGEGQAVGPYHSVWVSVRNLDRLRRELRKEGKIVSSVRQEPFTFEECLRYGLSSQF